MSKNISLEPSGLARAPTASCRPGRAGWRFHWILLALLMVDAPSLHPQERVVVSGVVVGEEGIPLPGVEILVPRVRRGGLSDHAGNFRLTDLRPGRTEIHFSLLGYAPERRWLEIGPDMPPLQVRLRPTPLTLPGLEVTALAGSRDPLAATQGTSQLAGPALERESGATLAQTLRSQPGIAVRFMGPAATMPVVRGLTGDRVLVLQDGQRTADLAGSADDHGVTIDPLAAQRVEIVRGPATLLYGNNAAGGVVNVVSGDIPTTAPARLEGVIGAQSESAYPGAAASGRASLPLGDGWVASFRGAARRTDDMRIPDDPELGNRLHNTDARNAGGAIGLSRIGEHGAAGVALRTYHFEYGLPVPPGATAVGLRGRRYEVSARGEVEPGGRFIRSVRASATAQRYGHDELDEVAGELLQEFALRTETIDLLVQQRETGQLKEGAWGASLLRKHYAATGPQALTPPADSRGIGFFAFQELELVPGRLALQGGGRVDFYRIASLPSERFGPAVERRFQAFSGALGLRVPLSAVTFASVHVGRSFRAPTVEELFSRAAHAGTGAVELGDPRLSSERGLSLEAMLRTRGPRWNGQFSIYRNVIGDFVHLQAQGDTVLYGVTLPVLRYAQGTAVLTGAEGSLEWAATRTLVLGITGDYLRASMRGGSPLSYMPPPRLGHLARWDDGTFSAGADVHQELAQERVGAAGELPTPAHTIVRLHGGLRLRLGGRMHSLTLRVENLGNEIHREATSRIKDFAPGPGRNFSVGYRLYY